VRYPVSDLLDIVALESVRAGAYVVGEDLGTVEEGVREELHERGMLSTRLLWFEDRPPEHYPDAALAAVTTHDLATIPGLWTGADLQAQRDLDLHPNEPSIHAQRDRLRDLAGVDDGAPVDDVVVATYRRLADAPSRIVTATLDDALGVEERPNQPGTVDEWPNWRLALPVPFEAITDDARVLAVAHALEERGR
jgi:4-alpha-glucanotransferase